MRRIISILISAIMVMSMSVIAFAQEETVAGSLSAKSAILMEISTGKVLMELNADEKLSPASITKVMTILLVFEALEEGKISLEDKVTASQNASSKGGSQIWLKEGEVMTVHELLKATVIASANDAAVALAEHICGSEEAFVDKMNEKTQMLGMKNTHFENTNGLDDTAENHVTSARDIAILSRELISHKEILKFSSIWMDTVRNGEFGLSNTNKLVRFYNGATGLKTGFTSAAGYCLSASAEREGMELIAVIMGCESSQTRFAACKSMLDYGFANYALVKKEVTEDTAVPVKLGLAETVKAVPGEDTALLVDKAQVNSVNITVELEEEIAAPVSKGQRLGTMTIKAGEQILAQIPLVAQEAVPRLSWGDIFRMLLRQFFMAK